MSFSYYILHHEGRKIYHRIGHNPTTGKFEFYASNDDKNWKKFEIKLNSQDETGDDFKVEGESQVYDCKLRVLKEPLMAIKPTEDVKIFRSYMTNRVLIYQKKGRPISIYNEENTLFCNFEQISINLLPDDLQAIERPTNFLSGMESTFPMGHPITLAQKNNNPSESDDPLPKEEQNSSKLVRSSKKSSENISLNIQEELPKSRAKASFTVEGLLMAKIKENSKLSHLMTSLKIKFFDPILVEELKNVDSKKLTIGSIHDLLLLQNYKTKKLSDMDTIASKIEAAQYKQELTTFYRKAIRIRLSDAEPKAKCQRLIEKAKTSFGHRDFGLRLAADFFLVLSCFILIGLVIGTARVVTGNTFLFSYQPTKREEDFLLLIADPKENEKVDLAQLQLFTSPGI
ncbi:MAG: hypothetical protein H0U70_01625 [Tatlockia sp.]|nr:hypothetical protein [Tatlockia sp.]